MLIVIVMPFYSPTVFNGVQRHTLQLLYPPPPTGGYRKSVLDAAVGGGGAYLPTLENCHTLISWTRRVLLPFASLCFKTNFPRYTLLIFLCISGNVGICECEFA